ncbi:hypothetical protein H4582DRAFT_2080039 [Lactarius indigo]|nr:hypothetical protein H4582DRAFT_2080039 [Lactarius indigo]
MGYFAEQTTKPQTLGFSLADSPVGLLAWVYKMLAAVIDAYPWTDDEGVDAPIFRIQTKLNRFHSSYADLNYWFSRVGPAASIRIYCEITLSDDAAVFPKTTVPIGLSFFPRELARFPKALLYSKENIMFESENKMGGHFAAYEQREVLVGDHHEMFDKSGPAAGVILGYTGY